MKIRKLDLDLMEEERSRELRAKRKVLSHTLEGSWSAMLKGRGMEFAGYRAYTPSDDASRIDWGATLRANETLVREFEEFKNVNVIMMVDVSDSMLFSSQRKLKAEHAAEIAFNIAVSLLNNGDSVGFSMFSDEIKAQEMPGVGRIMINRLAIALQDPKNYGGKKDFANVVTSINARLKERALIVIVSDFIGMEPGWDRYVRMLGQKFDLIGIMLRDPRDRELPKLGQYVLQDPASGESMHVDVSLVRDEFKKRAQEEEAYIKRVFDSAKAGLVSVTTDEKDLLRPIIRYFRRRATVVK